MSTEEFTPAAACRQRFKGIENFLKRVAFNLGNTPSQTEVKIISCIPIDVTDLQQKIIQLERQLGESKALATGPGAPQPGKPGWTSKLPGQKKTAVNTALLESKFPNVSTAISCKSLECDRSTSPVCLNSRKKKSNVSFIFPAIGTNEGPLIHSNENSKTTPSQATEENILIMEPYNIDPPPMTSEPKPNETKNFFKKKKKLLKNKKGKSPYIYYAQAMNSPFNKSDVTEEFAKKDHDAMSRSYLTKMINKQYKPKLLGDNISLISQFSKPVCRDDQPYFEGSCRYESDVCSCCHGPFHNIDNNVTKFNNPQTYMVNQMNTGSAYYDTNHYDLVPVKEKSVKIKKEFEIPRKKEPRPHIDMKCWPENVRSKYRYCSNPPMFNYQIARPRTEYIVRERVDNYVRERLDDYVRQRPMTVNRAEPIAKRVIKRRREINKRDRPISIETSKSCSIDFGNVYPKPVNKRQEILQPTVPITVPRKNAGCLTTVINNSECQTITSNLEGNLSDAKTEATLNQIKSILQSVLAEVKVSSQTRNQIPEKKPKKDAVVQKEPSQNNLEPSSLMNSITYSPYAMNHSPYMASCSRQLNPAQFCYPQSGLKCFQNFPLFIPPPGRHMCSSCYRNNSHVKSAYMKQATTIATNTDEVRQEHSKETENLIKEIYKSMALTMDIHNKDTSVSDYDDTMKSVHGFSSPLIMKNEPKKQPKKIRNVVQAVSELFMKKDIMVDTSDTLNTTVDSKLGSNEASTRSPLATSDTERRQKNERLQKYLRTRNMQAAAEAEKRTERMIHTATTITESETSSSDAESNTTLIRTKEPEAPKLKKEKQGLFSKMFKSVFKPKDKIKKKDEKTGSEGDTSTDSDDYQTIYSQKIAKPRKHRKRSHNLPKRKTHSKISYKQTYQRDRSPEKKRSPYMEQEYRRYWNEKLMFHYDKPNHSSDRMYSEQTSPQKSAYYRTYETRNASVEPENFIPKTEPKKGRMYRQENTETKTDPNLMDPKLTTKGIGWLKKHNMGIHCGEQWMRFLREG